MIARLRMGIAGSAVAVCALAGTAQAADPADGYPDRPIRLIVPFAPNGPNDLIARFVGQKLTQSWGQSVVVENKPGGATVTGTEAAATASADGYTLLMVSSTTATNPTLKKKLPYDTVRDFAPVIELATSPSLLVVRTQSPIASIGALTTTARAHPGQLTFASGGVGTATHLAGELLCMLADVRMIHVPYKGTGPAMADLLGGQIDWMFGPVQPTLGFVRSGKLRALGISSARRHPAMPDIPAVAETIGGFEAVSFWGIFAPVRTPGAIVHKLNREIARILALPDVREQLRAQGLDVVGGTPDQFAAHFRLEATKWAEVIQRSGVESQ